MKQSSQQTRILIDQLRALPLEDKDFFGRKKPSVIEQAVVLISEIVKTGEWTSIVSLLPYVVTSDRAIADAATSGVESLLENIRPALLLQLDEQVRGGLWRTPILWRWDEMEVSVLNKSLSKKKFRPAIAGVASFHRNGYLREAALKLLADVHSGKELPFFLIRLGDWVTQVRSLAEQEVEKRITPDYLPHFIENLVMLERMKQRQRNAGFAKRLELIERITNLLKESSHRKLLLDGLKHNDKEVRRTCLQWLKNTETSDCAEIIALIIKDSDVVNRFSVIDLTNNLPANEQLSILKQLAKDKASSIRRQALETLCEVNSDQGIDLLKAALLDKSAVVREYARWKLAKLQVIMDFREFYIEQLQEVKSKSMVAAAVAGLGETGKAEDAPKVLAFIEQGEIIITKAAVIAVARLDPENYAQVFLRHLQNSSPAVSTAAQKALAAKIDLISPDSLWNVLSAESPWHVKRNTVRLFNQLEKWDRVCYLLQTISLDDARLQKLALIYLKSWEQQYGATWQFTKARAAQQEKFAQAMSRTSSLLPDRLQETLKQCLKGLD